MILKQRKPGNDDMENDNINTDTDNRSAEENGETTNLLETGTVKPTSQVAGAGGMSEKLGLFTLTGLAIVVFQVTCEVGKQISNYSIQYYNGGKYPLPQTLIVAIVELLKLITTVLRSKGELPSFSPESLRRSLRFLLPSILYAINNNIYFTGLILVSPPIWLILCSFRTVISASVYKFILKRDISFLQFMGALLIVVSILVAKTGDLLSGATTNAVPLLAIVLAVIASSNSVGAAVYTESLFKAGNSSGEKFLDQQFWLYLYGLIVASLVHVISATNVTLFEAFGNLPNVVPVVQFLLVVALTFSSIGGLVVAAILKLLDNIVKEYSAATANILTALVCSFLFPEKFQFNMFIVLSMMFLFAGIYLYEAKKPKQSVHAASSLPQFDISRHGEKA